MYKVCGIFQEIREYHYEKPLKEAKDEYVDELEELKTNIVNQEAVPVLFEAKKVGLFCHYTNFVTINKL